MHSVSGYKFPLGRKLVICPYKKMVGVQSNCQSKVKNYKKLAEMFSAFYEDVLQNLHNHSTCRKLVFKNWHIKRVEDRAKASTSITSPESRKGRPPRRNSENLAPNRQRRLKTTPNSNVHFHSWMVSCCQRRELTSSNHWWPR